MSSDTESGYDAAIVFAWLNEHCTQTEEGRYTSICRRFLEETHRDTFDRWKQYAVVPLERWDEILCFYRLELWEFETWAEEHHGWNGYLPSSEAA